MTRWSLSLVATALTIVAGCAPTTVRSTGVPAATGPLPKPERVIVYDFAVSLDDITLNTGPAARLRRALSRDSQSEAQAEVGRQVAGKFSEELVKAIN